MVKICNCSKEEFKKILQLKNVVGVCAGVDFINFCKEYQCFKVKYVVDNNKKNNIVLGEHIIYPISFAELNNVIDENTILVLSSLLYSDEILKQLDRTPILNGIETYIPQLIEADSQTSDLPACDVFTKIPTKIHYCWFGKNEIPDEFKRYIDTWYKKCPNYEIIRWDESNYDITKNEYMYEAYKCKKWGFVPDYARLDIVYEHGGFYLDTDVELLQSLDRLRDYSFVCGFESSQYIALGLGFGAVAHNRYVNGMMKMYDELHFMPSDGVMNQTASPEYQTRYWLKQGLKLDGSLQLINDNLILSREYLCPVDTLGNGEPSTNSISIHHYAGTWLDGEIQAQKKRKIENRRMLLQRIM